MISVVIPSLGGDLTIVLNSLNFGSVKPDEIIVVLPDESCSIVNLDNYSNVRVIYSKRYGQVYQRICGFEKSKNEYILQLDDDIVVSYNCIKLLISLIVKDKRKIAVSPCWFNIDNGKPLHQGKVNGFIMSLYYWIVNGKKGYKPGELSRAGTNFGINPEYVSTKFIDVSWQPGGCVLHKRSNLILNDYYPYEGKAYYEDLIHSFLLRMSGVTLVVNVESTCMTHVNPRIKLGKEIIFDIRARRYFVKLANLSVFRMYVFYIIYIFRTILYYTVSKR